MHQSLAYLVRGMRDMRISPMPVVFLSLLAGGLYVFFQIADEVSENEIERLDDYVFRLFRSPADVADPLGPPWLEETMAEITSLGGYPILIVLVVSVVGFLLVAQKRGPALFVFLSVASGTLVGHVLKLVYDRPRPDLVEPIISTHTASFPSGHATMSAVVYLTLASLIVRLLDDTSTRIYVILVAVFLTLLIGISRIYLGVHWPSDVVAGWALGTAWASLSWLTVSALRTYRKRQAVSP